MFSSSWLFGLPTVMCGVQALSTHIVLGIQTHTLSNTLMHPPTCSPQLADHRQLGLTVFTSCQLASVFLSLLYFCVHILGS